MACADGDFGLEVGQMWLILVQQLKHQKYDGTA
jgi:hypothetical protein